jgi:glycosyltransferase involved in cell wall biosynthesis
MSPKVSIIMPAYNTEKFIGASIESVLNQTYKDFELIIVDDGSEDSTASIVKHYGDSRIVYFKNDANLGLAGARNIGLSLAKGEYIAWLDSDDLSHPARVEKQLKVLENNKQVGLCGTWVQTIGAVEGAVWKYPTKTDELRCRMLFDDPLATSSAMMRRECLDNQNDAFDPDYPPAEDYDLWERISQKWNLTNIPEILTYYRIHSAQTSKTLTKKQLNSIWRIQSRILEKLGIDVGENEKSIHLHIGVGWTFKLDLEGFCNTEGWLLKLYYANRNRCVFPAKVFKKIISDRYYMAYCTVSKNDKFKEKAWKAYMQSKISKWSNKMILRSIKKYLEYK